MNDRFLWVIAGFVTGDLAIKLLTGHSLLTDLLLQLLQLR